MAHSLEEELRRGSLCPEVTWQAVSPGEPAAAQEAEQADAPPAGPAPRVVAAVGELQSVGRTWCAAGVVGLAAGVALGHPDRLTQLEAFGAALLFFLTLGAVLGGLVLGRRSPPQSDYRRILELAPSPPPGLAPEPHSRTATRAVIAALFTAVGLFVGATVSLTAVLVGLGEPRDQLLAHLPVGAELIAAGWTLVCGLAALRVGGWFAYWQDGRERVVLCRPLTAGMMGHYYYAAERRPQPPRDRR